MSFQPIVPFGGLAGWSFLNRTYDAQQAAFDDSPIMEREVNYFLENIGKVQTADQLLADRTLRKVALGAFGLDADIDNRYFIKRVLEDGTLDPEALSNRLADKSYLEMSRAFGFGDSAVPQTVRSDFGDTIVSAYKTRQFEIAIGAQSEDLRLAFSLDRELDEITSASSAEDTKWYTIMGNAPMRRVFETAFGLPSSFVGLDLSKQLEILKDRAESAFGDTSVSQFSDADKKEELVRLFLVRSEIAAGPSLNTAGSAALTILSQINAGSSLLQTASLLRS